MPSRVDILIDINSRLQGIETATQGFAKLEQQTQSLDQMLKMGIGIDFGRRLVDGIARVPATFDAAIRRGLAFNQVVETSRLGIAGVIKQFDTTGRFSNFEAAMMEAAGTIEYLKTKAKESPATFRELVEGLQAITGAATSAGLTLRQQVDLVTLMSQTLSGLGLPSWQLPQESRALLTGAIDRNAVVARTLGITSEDIAKAKEAGILFEFLTKKMQGLAMAAEAGKTSMATLVSNLNDLLDQQLGGATEEIFEGLKEGIIKVGEAIGRMEPDSLRELGREIAGLLKLGVDLTVWAIENKDALIFLTRAAVSLGAAFTAIKITEVLINAGLLTAAWVRSTGALEAETIALGRNTLAQGANTRARAVGAGASGSGGVRFGAGATIAAVGVAALFTLYETLDAELEKLKMQTEDTLEAQLRAGRQVIDGLQQQINSMQDVVELSRARAAAERELAISGAKLAQFEAAGQEQLTNAYKGQIRSLETIIRLLRERGQAIVAENRQEAEQRGFDRQLDANLAKLRENKGKTDKSLAEARFNALPPEKQKAQLEGRLNEVTRGVGPDKYLQIGNDAIGKIQDPKQREAESLRLREIEAEILALKKAIAAADERIQRDAERARDIEEAKRGLAAEIAALRAEAAGDDRTAKAMRDENTLRERAIQLQRQLNISETEAVRLAREEMTARQQAEDRKRSEKQANTVKSLIEDYQITAARAAGMEDEARRLEDLKRQREEIRRIVEETGLSEQQARNYVTRMEALRNPVEDNGMRKPGAQPGALSRSLDEMRQRGVDRQAALEAAIRRPLPGAPVTPVVDQAMPRRTAPSAQASRAGSVSRGVDTGRDAEQAGQNAVAAADRLAAQLRSLIAMVKQMGSRLDDVAGQIKDLNN